MSIVLCDTDLYAPPLCPTQTQPHLQGMLFIQGVLNRKVLFTDGRWLRIFFYGSATLLVFCLTSNLPS
jgi:hypothetical protein